MIKKTIKGEANAALYDLSFITSIYPLKLSAILDLGTIIYVYNDLSRFYNFRKVPRYHYLITSNYKVPILCYRDIDINTIRPNGKGVLRLKNVTFYTNFVTNLISFRLLRKKGYY